MKFLISAIVFLFPGLTATKAQADLSRDEIIKYWTSAENKPATVTGFKTFDPKLDSRINSFIDNLNQEGIDQFILYSISYPGYISFDTCTDYIYPVYAYILWMTDKKLNIKTIKGKCESSFAGTDSAGIFDYYEPNKETIRQEVVMPVIFSAQQTADNHIICTMNSISHEPNYLLYFRSGKSFKLLEFSLNSIENKESLFHDYNLNLKSIQLWKLIHRQTRND